MNSVTILAHALDPKLSSRDALVFSTLCRDTLSMRVHTHIDAVLPTTSDVISFGLWMQGHARHLQHASVSSSVAAGASTIYMCGQCIAMKSCRLCLDRFETFGFHFLWMLEELHLDISHSVDVRVSMAATSFPALQSLTIESTAVRDPVPVGFVTLNPTVHRKAVALPDVVPNLTHLTVRNAVVEELPAMPSIRVLRLPSCRFGADVVTHLATLTTLTTLDLSKNVMSFIPDEIAALTRLKELNMSHNYITNYDDTGSYVDDTFVGIEPLTALTSLILHHNYVDNMGFDDSVPRLRCTLKHLDIACNPCTDIPVSPSLRHLTSLRTSCIPKHLHTMRDLTVLYVHGHCDVHGPYESHAATTVTAPPSLRAVHLDDPEGRISRDTMHLIAQFPSTVMLVDSWC